MAAPRKWTDEQQAEAMAIYERDGVAAAARETGIAAGTIKSWAYRNHIATRCVANTQEAVAMRQAERALIAEEIKDGFATLTLHMQEQAILEDKGTQAQAWTTSAAISADKLLLMSGEATSRHETRGGELERAIREQLERQRVRAMGERSADGRVIDPQAIEAESRTA